SRSDGPALSVAVGGRRFGLAAGAVRSVGPTGPLTVLPFAPVWIEGLTSVGERPLLQIDPARALGLPAGPARAGSEDKLVVIDTSLGTVALRVEAVDPTGEPVLPPLPLEALVHGLTPAGPAAAAGAVAAAPSEPPAVVLLVACGAARIAILIDEGVSVGEVASCRRVDTGDGDGQLVATVGDRLLPASRLSKQGSAGKAVIGPGADGAMVVLVERLIGLERIAAERLVLLPRAEPGRNLCFPMEGGDPVCLHDFATLAGGRREIGDAYRHLLDRIRSRTTAAAGVLPPGGDDGGGLLVSVGEAHWLLPLALVERMLGIDETPAGRRQRPGPGAVPVVDTGRWFPPAPAAGRPETVLLRPGRGGRLALRVDRIALDSRADAGRWLPPPVLPPALAALVDAVRPDTVPGRWCLRLASGADAAALPFSLRRAIAAAVLGRLVPAVTVQTNLQGT
ncbi:MAG: chemotaxis protein CheW, partial [Rhodospirillaceae bacterium]